MKKFWFLLTTQPLAVEDLAVANFKTCRAASVKDAVEVALHRLPKDSLKPGRAYLSICPKKAGLLVDGKVQFVHNFILNFDKPMILADQG
jgi:hypothetical protein